MCENIRLFKEGKPDKHGNNRYVAFTDEGKVIISEKPISTGYYTITRMRELPKCIIAEELVPVNCDYYPEIGYSRFRELLLERGYKISFEMPFKYKNPLDEAFHDEMRLVAFSRELNMVIVADTIYDQTKFNSINCYCYGVNGLYGGSILFSMGSSTCCVMDLTYSRRGIKTAPLHFVESICCRDENIANIHKSNMLPFGWTYADNPMDEEDFNHFSELFKSKCSPELRDYLYR